MGNARKTAVQALLRVSEESGYSNLVLDSILQKDGLSGQDKAFVSALTYGVLERQLTLDYQIERHSKLPLKKLSPKLLCILRCGVYQLLFMDQVPPSAAVNEAVKLTRQMGQSSAAGFVNAVLRTVGRDGLLLPGREKDPVRYLSVKGSCPQWLVRLWITAYGEEETERILKAFLGRPGVFLRVNTLKTSAQELAKRLWDEGAQTFPAEGFPHTLRLSGGAVEQLPSFQDGLFHVQNTASQLCCAALDVQPGMTVADVCSAPGGKAFTLAEMMENSGRVLAYDQYSARVDLIRKGAARLCINIIEAGVRDAAEELENQEFADRVLCDVPCSGLGVLGRKPEIRYKDEKSLEKLPQIQYNILCSSAKLLKIGGLLVYSTCTLNPAENEAVVERFLKEHPGFGQVPVSLPAEAVSVRCGEAVTLLPKPGGMDGFFFAVLRRDS